MKKLKICLSFDDGRKDFYDYAFPILKKYDLPATLNVTSGYVDGSFVPNWGSSYGAVSKEELKELKQSKIIELAYHGDQHKTEKKDFKNSIDKFQKWKIKSEKMGFAVPGSYLKGIDIKDLQAFLNKNNVIYMRSGNAEICDAFLNKVYRKLYRLTKMSLFYQLYNRNNLINKIIPYKLPSVVIFKDDKAFTIKKFLKHYCKRNKSVIFMLHGILPDTHACYGKDEYAWSQQNFEEFCKYLRKLVNDNKIEVLTVMNLVTESNYKKST